jgi:hypothetical protein
MSPIAKIYILQFFFFSLFCQIEGQDAVRLFVRQTSTVIRQQEDPGRIEGAARSFRHQLQRTNETQAIK